MPTLTVKPSSRCTRRRIVGGGGQRRAEQLGAGHVEKRLVDAVLFNIRGIIVQKFANQCLAVFYVKNQSPAARWSAPGT